MDREVDIAAGASVLLLPSVHADVVLHNWNKHTKTYCRTGTHHDDHQLYQSKNHQAYTLMWYFTTGTNTQKHIVEQEPIMTTTNYINQQSPSVHIDVVFHNWNKHTKTYCRTGTHHDDNQLYQSTITKCTH